MMHQRDDHQAHRQLAHERYVAHLEAMIDEGNAALGWLQAWPNEITNSDEDMESVLNALGVALRRARPADGTPLTFDRDKPAAAYTFDASGDVEQR